MLVELLVLLDHFRSQHGGVSTWIGEEANKLVHRHIFPFLSTDHIEVGAVGTSAIDRVVDLLRVLSH